MHPWENRCLSKVQTYILWSGFTSYNFRHVEVFRHVAVPTSTFWLQAAAWFWSESSDPRPSLHVGLVCRAVSEGWRWIPPKGKETRSSASKSKYFLTHSGDMRVLTLGRSFGQLWTTGVISSNPLNCTQCWCWGLGTKAALASWSLLVTLSYLLMLTEPISQLATSSLLHRQ